MIKNGKYIFLIAILLLGAVGVWMFSSKEKIEQEEVVVETMKEEKYEPQQQESQKPQVNSTYKKTEEESTAAAEAYIKQKSEEVMKQSKKDYEDWKDSEGYANLPKLEERRKLEYEIKTESRREVLGKLQKERLEDVKTFWDLTAQEEQQVKNCFDNRDLHALYLEQKRLKRYYEDRDSFTYEHVDAGEKEYDRTELIDCLSSFLSGQQVGRFKQYLSDEIKAEQEALEAHRKKMEPHRRFFDKYLEANGLKNE